MMTFSIIQNTLKNRVKYLKPKRQQSYDYEQDLVVHLQCELILQQEVHDDELCL